MKKVILICFSMLLVLILAACEGGSNNPLPSIEGLDVVELSLIEKYEFLQSIDYGAFNQGGISINQFAEIDFAMESESNYSLQTDFFTKEEQFIQRGSIGLDYESNTYGFLGDSAASTIFYANIDHAIFNFGSYNYSSVSYDDSDAIESEVEQNASVNITNSFFLLLNKIAYIQSNGSSSSESINNGDVASSTSSDYDMLKEKSEDEVFTTEMYDEIKSYFEQLESISDELPEELPTEIELSEALQELNDMVTVYQSGDVYTIRFYITKAMVDSLIDKAFTELLLLAEEANEAAIAEMENLRDLIKTSFKSFEFDYRIEVEDQKITRILFFVSGEFTGFQLNQPDDSGHLKLDIKIERLGFVIDFNANQPTLPTSAYLADFEPVTTPSIFGAMS